MFWGKEKNIESEFVAEEVTVNLYVYLKDGGKINLSQTWKENTDYIKKHYNGVWVIKMFYKWYFGRPQSNHYQLEASNGVWTIRRDQITKIFVDFQVSQSQEI